MPPAQCRRRSPVRASLRALALLVLAAAAPLALARLLVAAAPVAVSIEGDGEVVRITVEGTSRRIALPAPIVAVRPVPPVAWRREHQIDGSDSTNMLTFDAAYFADFAESPYYQLQAVLREEWRYSRWADLEVADIDGRVVERIAQPADDVAVPVPRQFQLTVGLERPEIPRALELLDEEGRTLVLELNRNDKYVRLGPSLTRGGHDLVEWYFPRDWRPPAATLFDLAARAVALAASLLLTAGALALLPGVVGWQPGRRAFAAVLAGGSVFFLAASVYVAAVLFDRAPHILDAIAYVFQAKTFAEGALWAPPPPVLEAFPMPFSVIYDGRWFAQYPPGTAALLALGMLVQLPWLVQPLLGLGAVVLIALTVRRQYGAGTAVLVTVVLVSSPFLLLTAGSFLSHVPALSFAAVALFAVTRYVERPSVRWTALAAAGLGLALLTREIVALLYGPVLLGAALAFQGRERGWRLALDGALGGLMLAGAVAVYLGYNAALTGEPFLLPRLLFNPRDVLGFGEGIGFYGEHTVASGLVNAEQQLVSLGFALAGWPYGFSLAVMLLPFVTRRCSTWDLVYGLLAALFVVVYVTEFYHGIAFGPRYYFEALPAFVALSARGLTALADTVAHWLDGLGAARAPWRARQAVALIGVALLACNALYYLPRQATLYAGYNGLPGGHPRLDASVAHELSGRTVRLSGALVVTREWWWYTMHFAALNCPRLDCPVVFALADEPRTRAALAQRFRDRTWYEAVERGGVLTIVPGRP